MSADDPLKTRTADDNANAESVVGQGDTGLDTSFVENQNAVETPGTQIGHYRLIEPLGTGGFGIVWLAEQFEPVQRQVALKMLNPGMDSREIIARFAQERQALAVMDHPGIAQVFDAGMTDRGRPYFVMELVRGVPLNVYCDEKKLGTRQRLKIFIDICLAVQHAHQKGVIHRDLKPNNILVCDSDNGPLPKIIDFGIAKATTQTETDESMLTRVGQFIGTPAYMSPEQAGGLTHDLDTRSDVYSLGVVLYRLLTGHLPFENKGPQPARPNEIFERIRDQIPARPSTRLKSLPPQELADTANANGLEAPRLIQSVRGDLDWIVMKALEKDRTRRYDTALDFAADIRRHLANQPVIARPPTAGYLVRRFVARHRTAVVAASLVLLSLVAGLAVSTSMFFREAAARSKADKAAVRARQTAAFLEEMLKSVGPSRALGRDTTMLREVLDATAARVHDDLGQWPDLEAELRTVLGNTYDDLAEYQRALDMHREALRLRRQVLPPDDPQISETLFRIAYCLDFTDGLGEAEEILRQVIDIETRAIPRRSARLAEAQDMLAWILLRQGRLAEAEQVSRQMLETLKPTDQESQAIRTRSLDTLGSILLKSAQFAESEKVHRQCLQETIELEGESHPRVVTSINNLCQALVRTGKFDEVERIANEALTLQAKVTGKLVSSSTDSLHKALAQACESRQDYANAITHLETAVEAASQMFGPDHGFCNDKRALLARMLTAAGRLDDAERTIHEIRANGGTDNAENSVDVAASQLALARGDAETAASLAQRELDRIRGNTRIPSLQTVEALQALAAAHLAQGKRAVAESELREAIGILKPDINAGMPMLVSLEKDLVEVLNSGRKKE